MHRATLALVAAALLSACAGRTITSPVAGSTPSASADVLHVANLTVASGATLTLSKPTTYISTGPVEIDGIIVLASGASVAIFAPSITIKGTIGPAGAAASSSSRVSAAARKPSDTPLNLPPNMLLSDNIVIDQPGGFVGTNGVDLAAQSPNGTVTISGNISGGDGAPATAQAAPSAPGGAKPGGSIEIGTAAAIDDVKAAALAAGFLTSAFAPASITVSGSLHGGFGGNGYSDPSGVVNGGTVTVAGTDGAPGGNVDISAGSVTTTGATLRGGIGGFGGAAGPFVQLTFATPVDGVGQGVAGLNLVATTGNGAAGGSVTISGTSTGQPGKLFGGPGGGSGHANVRAGNGGAAAAGGTTMVTVGSPGNNGVPVANPPPQTLDIPILLTGGGSGGAAAATGSTGGSAGAVTIGGPGLIHAAIAITNYANAGPGFGACSSAFTPNIGSNAGASASLTDGKQAYRATNSFNGANGGDGLTVVGSGTAAGTDDTGKKIGQDGTNGVICGSGTVTPPPTTSPPPSIYGPLVVNPTSGTSSSVATQTFAATQTGYTQSWGVSIGGNCAIAPAVPSGPGPTNVIVSHTGALVTAGQDSCVIVLSGPTPTGVGASVTATYRATFTP